jgi:hypothetical protein
VAGKLGRFGSFSGVRSGVFQGQSGGFQKFRVGNTAAARLFIMRHLSIDIWRPRIASNINTASKLFEKTLLV